MSPRILREAPYDPFKADVWSLGVTLDNLATGELPWHGTLRIFYTELPHFGVRAKIAKLLTSTVEPDPEKRIKLEDIALELFETKSSRQQRGRRSKSARYGAADVYLS
jgi:serine/threonine protein kinase